MNAHFNNQDQKFAFDRKFFSIPKDQINCVKSSTIVNTLSGVPKYNCFVMKNTNYVWYRSLSCHCNDCNAALYTLCKYSAVCDAYASHTWIKPNRTVPATTNHDIGTTQRLL